MAVGHWQGGLWSLFPSRTTVPFLTGNDLSESEPGLHFFSLGGAPFSGFWLLVLALKSLEEACLCLEVGREAV